MIIHLRTSGDLRAYFGSESLAIELQNKANIFDLMHVIDDRWGEILPGYLWDRKEKRFRGAVAIIIDRKLIKGYRKILKNGTEIQIVKAIIGG